MELKDSDGRPDEEVAQEVMSDDVMFYYVVTCSAVPVQAWDYHLSRNQSVIVDLFHGQVGLLLPWK